MADIFKFPNGGYEVTVRKKEDILKTIDDNILDKDVALAVINQLEVDAANFIQEGRWTGIPFIGNIRIPKARQIIESDETQALIKEAKEQLDSHKYILFRTQLGKETSKKVKQERYYKYITSIAVSHNRKLYEKLCREEGEYYARIYMFASYNITSVDNEYEINYGE